MLLYGAADIPLFVDSTGKGDLFPTCIYIKYNFI
jgi:hypothetical protein